MGQVVLVLATLLATYAYRKGLLGQYPIESHLFAASGYFCVGIMSRFWLKAGAFKDTAPACLIFLFFCYYFDIQDIGLIVWGCFFLCLRGRVAREGWLFRMFDLAFASKGVLAIGRASYSLYLLHRPVEVSFAIACIGFFGNTHHLILASQFFAIAVSIPLAMLMWRFVEMPGQQIGRRIPNILNRARGA